MSMIQLFTTFYKEPNTERNAELLRCISNNLKCNTISKIVILNENGDLSPFLSDSKLVIIPINQRPIYNDFFNTINSISTKNDINIIANTDIFFDESIEILNHINLDNKCLALSRWDIVSNSKPKLYERADSQDCWIFKGKIKPIVGNLNIGVPRCDNRIAYEIQKADYQIVNPAYSIKSYHLHQNRNLGEYSKENLPNFVEPPYLYLPVRNLNNFMVNVFYSIFYKYKYRKYYQGECQKRRLWIIRFLKKFKTKPYKESKVI